MLMIAATREKLRLCTAEMALGLREHSTDILLIDGCLPLHQMSKQTRFPLTESFGYKSRKRHTWGPHKRNTCLGAYRLPSSTFRVPSSERMGPTTSSSSLERAAEIMMITGNFFARRVKEFYRPRESVRGDFDYLPTLAFALGSVSARLSKSDPTSLPFARQGLLVGDE